MSVRTVSTPDCAFLLRRTQPTSRRGDSNPWYYALRAAAPQARPPCRCVLRGWRGYERVGNAVGPGDGAVYLPTRPSGDKDGVLVAWGYTTLGKRVLVAVRLGQRQSHEDWLDA